MATSLPQVALLLVVLIAAPAISIRIVRGGTTGALARPLKFLHLGFWGAVLCFALAMGADRFFAVGDATSLLPYVLMAAFYVFACFYWTALGVLAHRLQRNWILWVAVGLATLAIGFFATYVMMVIQVRSELALSERQLGTSDQACPP